MLTNVFSFENGQLLQIDDLIARIPARKPSGPTVDDPIGNVIITLSTDVMLLLIDASGDLSTLDHYEIVAYSEGGQPVKTVNIGKLTEYEMTSLDKEILEGNYTIECTAVSVHGNTSKKSNSIEYTVLPSPKAMTLRFAFSQKDYNPETAGVGSAGTWAKVDSPTLNIWDWTNEDADWSRCFKNAFLDSENEVSVIMAGDTSSVTNVAELFYASTSGSRNYIVECYPFDISNCTTMQNMLMKTALSKWPRFKFVGGTAVNMFRDTFLVHVPDIDMGNVMSIKQMLGANSLLETVGTIKISSSCTNVESLFAGSSSVGICGNLVEFGGLIGDLSGVTSYFNMFQQCVNLKSVKNPLDLTNVTSVKAMFNGCFSLETAPFINWHSDITEMYGPFASMRSLSELPDIDTGTVTKFSMAFYDCRKVTAIPDYDVSSATSVDNMFYNCRNVKYGMVEMYNKLKARGDAITNHTDCFGNCGIDTDEGRAALAQIPQSWGGLAED